LAALLSSIGVRVILHGIQDIGPKYGITPLKIIQAQNPNFQLSLPEIITRIQNDQCGWSYIDQSSTFPSLYQLKDCRKHMVKRPIISTIEKLLCPIYSNHNHILVTGFTHPPYRQKMIHLFKHHPLIKKGIIIRGMEGSPQLPLDRRSPFILVNEQNSTESFMCPSLFNISKTGHSFPENLSPEQTLKIGTNALKGENGWARDQLIYQALAITQALSIKRTDDALSALCLSIETGMAYHHWEIGTK
jgi:anthranilate phosphoribosyltransferase